MMSIRERVLVTGAAGFIGSHVVDRLLALGAVVVGVDNFDPFYSPVEKRSHLARALQHPGFRLVEADCADPDGLDAALAGASFDAVVHLAAKVGVRPSILDPVGYARANVVATRCVLEFACQRDVRRVVFGSSSSVYGDSPVPFSEDQAVGRPVSPYAATKRAAELLCAAYQARDHLSIVALRFFTVYGPRQRPDLAVRKFGTLMLRDAPLPLYGDGSTERDYTWIDDVVGGIVAALSRTQDVPGQFEIVNLGGQRATSLRRLVELLGAALRVEPRVVRLPLQPGDVVRTCADVTKARRLLGYVPRVPVEEGIRRFADWLRSANERAWRREPAGRRWSS